MSQPLPPSLPPLPPRPSLPPRAPLPPRRPPTAVLPAGVPPTTELEAFEVLAALARRKAGAIPEAVLARHVLGVTAGADWPVQRAALEALVRRAASGLKDGLRVVSRPAGGAVRGRYGTGRKRAHDRPYETWLDAVEPPRGSCDCPDFVRGSLGLCKHLLVVLDDCFAHPARRRARGGAGRRGAGAPGVADRDEECRAVLSWDPVRPLTGPGDALARLRLGGGDAVRVGAVPATVRRWFERDQAGGGRGAGGNGPGAGDGATFAAVPRERPAARLAQVRALLALAPRRSTDRGGVLLEPAVRRLLEDEAARLERTLSVQASGAALRRALRTLRRPLYPYQREGVERFLASGALLLADDMGLGKTAQAIAGCHALFTAGRVRRGLVIVPASLKAQWLREWQAFSRVPVAVVDGYPPERAAIYRGCRRGFLIINYEQVLRDLELLRDFAPDLVVLDEAQRIKNWATKTAGCVKQLRPTYRLVLTGTPMENRLDELASIVEWVDDEALEPKWRLQPWHAQHADGQREVVGARHLDTLRTRLRPALLRRVRREVLTQLPPRTDTAVPVALTPEQAEEHAALDQPIARLVQAAARRPLSQEEFLRLMSLLTTQRIVANGLAQLRFATVWPELEGRAPTDSLLATLAAPKLGELREILAQVAVAQRRKVVVFSQWRRMLTLAAWATSGVLGAAGLRAAFFSGQEQQRRRTQNLVEFHDDPAVAVLFATDAGGVGLNLQRAASCCVNLELPWNPAVLEQRIGRIYRHGQTAPVDVYNLVTQDSIEARIAGLVADKRALFGGLFDGESDAVRFERAASFLARLERLVAPAVAAPPPAEEASEEGEAGVEAAAAEEEVVAAAVAEAADEAEDAAPGPDGGVGAGSASTGSAVVAPPPAAVDLALLAAAAVPPPAATALAAATGSPPTTGPEPETGVPSRPAATPVPAATPMPAATIQRLFQALEVRVRPDGGVTIEAPPDAALGLAAVFDGMAALMRRAASPAPPP